MMKLPMKPYPVGYSNKRINRLLAKCFRCSYEWIPRVEEIKTCAKCRSPYWDKAKNKLSYMKMRDWASKVLVNYKYHGFIVNPEELKCVDCGNQAKHWEHRNYARPLLVEPVCQSCNYKRGRSINYE